MLIKMKMKNPINDILKQTLGDCLLKIINYGNCLSKNKDDF